MKTPIDPIVIDKSGVHVAGHLLSGVTRWAARHEPERGVFEVQLTLVTSKCRIDMDAGQNLLGAPPSDPPTGPAPKIYTLPRLSPGVVLCAVGFGRRLIIDGYIPTNCNRADLDRVVAVLRDLIVGHFDTRGSEGAGFPEDSQFAGGPGRLHVSLRASSRRVADRFLEDLARRLRDPEAAQLPAPAQAAQ